MNKDQRGCPEDSSTRSHYFPFLKSFNLFVCFAGEGILTHAGQSLYDRVLKS